MNVILDLNGLLCVIEDSKSKGPGKECNHCWSHGLSRLAQGRSQGCHRQGVNASYF